MADITYQIALYDEQGERQQGVLAYRFVDGAPEDAANIATSRLLQQSDNIELTVFALRGTLAIPGLLGSTPAPIAGAAYVSLLGPTLTSIFVDDGSPYAFSLQFGFIDSAARQIGGGFALRQQSGEDQGWSILGKLQA